MDYAHYFNGITTMERLSRLIATLHRLSIRKLNCGKWKAIKKGQPRHVVVSSTTASVMMKSTMMVRSSLCAALCWTLFSTISCSVDVTTTTSSTTASPVHRPKITYKDYNFENCTETNLDECSKVVFLYSNRGVHLPTNKKQMVPHCREEKTAAKCVFDYGRKCLKSFPRQALLMMMTGATKNIRERCSKAGTETYLKNKKCVRRSADSQFTCMEGLTANLNSVRSNPEKSDWLPSVCCYIDKWKKCFEDGAAKHCDEGGLKFLRWGADAYVSDLTDLACGSKLSWTGTRCTELIKKVESAAPSNSTSFTPKSVIVPMFRIITGYADWEKRGPPKFKLLNAA